MPCGNTPWWTYWTLKTLYDCIIEHTNTVSLHLNLTLYITQGFFWGGGAVWLSCVHDILLLLLPKYTVQFVKLYWGMEGNGAYVPPFAYKLPLHFRSKFLCRYFYLTNRPPQPWPCYQNSNMIRYPWWSGNARTKPASTDQLRNSPTITSVSAIGVNAIAHWKDKPVECLENAAVYAVAIYAVANLCQLILTIKFLEDKRSEGRSVLNQLVWQSVI